MISFTSIIFANSLALPLAQTSLIASPFKKNVERFVIFCSEEIMKLFVKLTFVIFECTFYGVLLKTAACVSGAVLVSCR